jgi:hypothetical protein
LADDYWAAKLQQFFDSPQNFRRHLLFASIERKMHDSAQRTNDGQQSVGACLWNFGSILGSCLELFCDFFTLPSKTTKKVSKEDLHHICALEKTCEDLT